MSLKDFRSTPSGTRTPNLLIKSLVGLGPKYGTNQCETWDYVGFSRIRAPPKWEFPVPKLTHELTQPPEARGNFQRTALPARIDELFPPCQTPLMFIAFLTDPEPIPDHASRGAREFDQSGDA